MSAIALKAGPSVEVVNKRILGAYIIIYRAAGDPSY